MAKKDTFVVVIRKEADVSTLINAVDDISLGSDGNLKFKDEVVGGLASQEIIKWVMQNNSGTFMTSAPRADIKVSLSLVGTYGGDRCDVVVCTKLAEVAPEVVAAPQKSFVKKLITLEFKGTTFTAPGKVPLIQALSNGKTPKVTFTRQDAGEASILFNGESAGKTKITEDIKNIHWESIKQDAIKSIKAEDMKVVVQLEVSEEQKIDYTSVIDMGLAIGMPQEQIEKRIEIFANRYFMSKEEIEFVAKSWKPVKLEGLMFIPDIDKVNYVDGRDRTLYYLLGYYAEEPNKNLRLVGIQSTGKNTLVEQLASLLWKPLLQLSCSRETSREDFEGAVTIGHKVYKHDREELEAQLLNGNFTEFQRSSMLAKIVELSTETVVQTLEFLKEPLVVGAIEGWWVLLDEINLTSSSVTSRFHSLLDYRREITVPKLGTVKAADGFAVVTTMNPNSFAGANQMNQAFETRFRTIELSPRSKIADILKTQCPNASDEDIKQLDNLYDSIFTEVANEKLPDSFLSVRNFIDALNIKGFSPLKQRATHNISRISVNEPDSNKIVEDLIDTLF